MLPVSTVHSIFYACFVLLRLFEHFPNAPVVDELATVGLNWAPTASAPRYMPSKENQVHK